MDRSIFYDEKLEKQVERILETLTLKEKVALLSGKDFWSTYEHKEKELNSVTVTDGPHGVRIGNETSEREKDGTATAFPTGVAMASTWDQELIYEVAVALAEETRANSCDVLLGPCVNIVRTPVAGRNFETYAEDPYLAGKIGASYVNGLQSRGVGACVKHYACNNQEFERSRGDSVVDERTLREIYLTAFEMIVKEANPWTMMCSYNRINGEHASQNKHLLTEILRDEWAYDGVMVSDWNANHEIYKSVAAGLDLEMPGPYRYYGPFLEEAVKAWQIDESDIDRAAKRMIRLSKRVESYNASNPDDNGAFSNDSHKALAFRLAADSMILLKNESNALPIKKEEVQRIAVIGPCADKASYGGGGSSIVNCEYNISPLEGLKNYYGEDVEILYEKGCSDRVKADSFLNAGLQVTYNGESGFREVYYDNRNFEGMPITDRMTNEVDFWQLFPQDNRIDPMSFSVVWEGDMQTNRSGDYVIKFSYQGNFRLYLDDNLIEQDLAWHDEPPYPFYTIKKTPIKLDANKVYNVRLEFINTVEHERNAMILKAQYIKTESEIKNEIRAAIDLALTADKTIIFAGHSAGFEQEGIDRDDLTLPGAQNQLITELIDEIPEAVVVLNTGAPVEMPWVHKASAVVQAHFYGQEGGNAIASVISGDTNPSGRLTTTYPLRYQDNPSYIHYPGYKKAVYGEGIFVGYRYYDYKAMPVLFPFGHGLSYTTFDYTSMIIEGNLKDKNLKAVVLVRNNGHIEGQEVVQLYVSDETASLKRPVNELKGFKKIHLKPNESKIVEISLDERSFAFFDSNKNTWRLEPGEFVISVGASSRDIRLTKSITL